MNYVTQGKRKVEIKFKDGFKPENPIQYAAYAAMMLRREAFLCTDNAKAIELNEAASFLEGRSKKFKSSFFHHDGSMFINIQN